MASDRSRIGSRLAVEPEPASSLSTAPRSHLSSPAQSSDTLTDLESKRSQDEKDIVTARRAPSRRVDILTIDDMVRVSSPTEEKSLPACLQKLVASLEGKRADLEKTYFNLIRATSDSLDEISKAKIMARVERREEWKRQDVNRLIATNLEQSRSQQSILQSAKVKIRLDYENDLKKLKEFNETLLRALVEAAQLACESLLSIVQQESDAEAYFQGYLKVWRSTFGFLQGQLKFDSEQKKYVFEKNLGLEAAKAPSILERIQIQAHSIHSLAAQRIRAANGGQITDRQLTAQFLRDAPEEQFAVKIVLTCLHHAMKPLLKNHLLVETEDAKHHQQLDFSPPIDNLLARVESYNKMDTELKKSADQRALESDADKILHNGNLLAARVDEERVKLEEEYKADYANILVDIVDFEKATQQLEAAKNRYDQAGELKDSKEFAQLRELYDTEKRRNITRPIPDYASALRELKEKYGSKLDVHPQAELLETRFKLARHHYKKYRIQVGRFLADDLSPKPIAGTMAEGEEKKTVTADAKIEQSNLLKDLIKSLQTIVKDNNVRDFWTFQANTSCCFFAHRIRNTNLPKVPTGIGKIKELLRDDPLLRGTQIDQLAIDDVFSLALKIKAIVDERLTKGKGRVQTTTGVLLDDLHQIFSYISSSHVDLGRLTESIRLFKTHMFDLRDSKARVLNLVREPVPSSVPSTEEEEKRPLLGSRQRH